MWIEKFCSPAPTELARARRAFAHSTDTPTCGCTQRADSERGKNPKMKRDCSAHFWLSVSSALPIGRTFRRCQSSGFYRHENMFCRLLCRLAGHITYMVRRNARKKMHNLLIRLWFGGFFVCDCVRCAYASFGVCWILIFWFKPFPFVRVCWTVGQMYTVVALFIARVRVLFGM